ncbi:hypothetical protein HLH17_16335 [Acinetobacter sp. ANC 5380]|uniref:DUF6471 domain-containing protein n=1 Tax=Acinetobacter terrae TaxID=2731247 RepID=A0A7Y2RI22_9GAMM|nr:hypothetical protein [Acinetobacter terrae]
MNNNEWKIYTKSLLKSEIARSNLNYSDVVERLEKMGIHETPQNLSNKINRGTFSATFLLQVLKAIQCSELNVK